MGPAYAKLSRPVPRCAGYRTVEVANDLVARLIDPALAGAVDGKTWPSSTLDWT